VNYQVGNSPLAVAVGDFNDDGKPDLAVVNRSSRDASVLLGNGDGTLQKAAHYDLGQTPSFVATGDFNGDQRLDLVVAEGANNIVSVLLGNGDGTFQPTVSYNTGVEADYVASADFNGDDKPDLLISSKTGSIGILLGNGDGTFQAVVLTLTPANTPFAAVGDFDGDGRLDVITAKGTGNIELESGNLIFLMGNGDGTFQVHNSATLSFRVKYLVAADLNGDGKVDLAATSDFKNIQVFFGNGDGTLSASSEVRGQFASLIAIADMNDDGRPDLFGLEHIDPQSNPMEIQWMLNNGNGTFQDAIFNPCAQSSGCLQLSAQASWLAVADLNGDGFPDLIVTNVDDNSISVFMAIPPTGVLNRPNYATAFSLSEK